MASRLKKLRLAEISLVDKGASGDASLRPKVLIAKRAGDPPAPKGSPMSFFKKLFGKSEVAKELPDLMTMLDEVLGKLSESQQAELKPLLIALMQAKPPAPAPAPESKPEPEAEKKEGDVKPDEEMLKGLVAKSLEDAMDPIKKDLDAKTAEVKKLTEDLAKSQAETEKVRLEKRRADFTKRVSVLKYIPGKHEDIAKNLEDIDAKVSAAAADAMLKQLEDANALISKSKVFHKGAGTGPGGEDHAEGSVAGKVNKAIDDMLAEVRKSGKKLTRQQAFAKVFEGLTAEERRELAAESNPSAARA